MDLLLSLVSDIQPGRLMESLLLLGLFWTKVKPHLTKIEDELNGIKNSMVEGFSAGEKRFESIEARLSQIENKSQGGA